MNRQTNDAIDKVKEIQEVVEKYISTTHEKRDEKDEKDEKKDREEKIFGSKNSLDSPFYEMANSVKTNEKDTGRDPDLPTFQHFPGILDEILKIVREFEEKECDIKLKYKDADTLRIFDKGLNELYDYIIEIEKETAEQAIKTLKRHISVAHSRKILYQASGVYLRYFEKTKKAKKSKT